ncbi:hypothetical protein [Cellulomonas sp. ATA003]|uniref:glucuronyl esterase domain-containing protein n=1 Tax=Cellulomonas sp. ATA003 TaxID=3073064 RepID=UPI002873AA52|nr:hypothetical protein [Cellulomonas sp. ATA003]WNB86066.1 hypothetical protein REH70_01895 [Cellulomonas sp. ATA003]
MTVALGLGGQSAVAVPGAAPGSGDGPAGGAVVVPPGTPPNPAAPRPYFPADVTQIPATESLPDLFTFLSPTADPNGNGTVDDAGEWDARADELADALQYYLYGYQHPTPEDGSVFTSVDVPETTTVTFSAVFDFSTFTTHLPAGSYTFAPGGGFTLLPVPDFVAEAAYDAPDGYPDWAAGDTWDDHRDLLTVTPATARTEVRVSDPEAPGATTASIRLDAFEVPVQGVDTDLPGPYPVVLTVGGLSAQQVTTLKANGYAYVSMNTGSVYSDSAAHTGAYNELYPYRAGTYEYDSGTLLGWAWGISRIVDAIKNDAEAANSRDLAWDQTAVTGVSRNGKAAVLAAAFDERIAVAAPSDPGGGGLSGFRYSTEGQMFTYDTPDGFDGIYSRNETVLRAMGMPYWFTSKALDFRPDKAEHAPFDLHAVAALVAPRPLITWTGEAQQAWLNSPSTVVSLQAAREAYELLGAGDDIAWVVRDAAHANQDRDLPDLVAIMDREFGRSDTLTRRHLATLAEPDGSAKDGSGVIYPEATFDSIAAMSRSPYELELVDPVVPPRQRHPVERGHLRHRRPGAHPALPHRRPPGHPDAPRRTPPRPPGPARCRDLHAAARPGAGRAVRRRDARPRPGPEDGRARRLLARRRAAPRAQPQQRLTGRDGDRLLQPRRPRGGRPRAARRRRPAQHERPRRRHDRRLPPAVRRLAQDPRRTRGTLGRHDELRARRA